LSTVVASEWLRALGFLIMLFMLLLAIYKQLRLFIAMYEQLYTSILLAIHIIYSCRNYDSKLHLQTLTKTSLPLSYY